MTPLLFTVVCFAISIAAGFIGALLGLGGGIIVVPALTLLHVDIRYAIGASIVSVIATSSGAAIPYVRDRLSNLRVAMFLEMGTVLGALSGAFLAGILAAKWLYILFGLALLASAVEMVRRQPQTSHAPGVDPIADRLRLHGSYYDPALGEEVAYHVAGTRRGLGLMYVAGALSGLLGIGSGVLKVTAMDIWMGMPFKASTATSNFMIGVTAAAGAGVYLARGDIQTFIAAPVAIGVLTGSFFGSRVLPRLPVRALRRFFVLVLIAVAVHMFLDGLR